MNPSQTTVECSTDTPTIEPMTAPNGGNAGSGGGPPTGVNVDEPITPPVPQGRMLLLEEPIERDRLFEMCWVVSMFLFGGITHVVSLNSINEFALGAILIYAIAYCAPSYWAAKFVVEAMRSRRLRALAWAVVTAAWIAGCLMFNNEDSLEKSPDVWATNSYLGTIYFVFPVVLFWPHLKEQMGHN